MARTYRRRRSGVKVRDGGTLFCPGCQEWKEFCRLHLPKIRTWFHQETTAYRRDYSRRYRNQVKDRVRHEDWDNLPRYRHTQGWLSW